MRSLEATAIGQIPGGGTCKGKRALTSGGLGLFLASGDEGGRGVRDARDRRLRESVSWSACGLCVWPCGRCDAPGDIVERELDARSRDMFADSACVALDGRKCVRELSECVGISHVFFPLV
jgi:hypothetical protein